MNGLGAESGALLEAAREAEEPTLADRERVRRAIASRLVAGAAGLGVVTTAKSAVTAALVPGSTTKAVVAALLVGAVGVGAVWKATRPGALAPLATLAASPSWAGASSAAAHETSPARAPGDTTQAPGVSSPLPVATTSHAPAIGPHPSLRAVSAPGPGAPLHRPPSADVAAEVRLLGEAHAAMRSGDEARAMALLDEHARRYPRGALGEEREAARIAALCALGRTSDARDAADAFLRSAPQSPLAGPVRASCGGSSP